MSKICDGIGLNSPLKILRLSALACIAICLLVDQLQKLTTSKAPAIAPPPPPTEHLLLTHETGLDYMQQKYVTSCVKHFDTLKQSLCTYWGNSYDDHSFLCQAFCYSWQPDWESFWKSIYSNMDENCKAHCMSNGDALCGRTGTLLNGQYYCETEASTLVRKSALPPPHAAAAETPAPAATEEMSESNRWSLLPTLLVATLTIFFTSDLLITCIDYADLKQEKHHSFSELLKAMISDAKCLTLHGILRLFATIGEVIWLFSREAESMIIICFMGIFTLELGKRISSLLSCPKYQLNIQYVAVESSLPVAVPAAAPLDDQVSKAHQAPASHVLPDVTVVH